jgi:hypothetical protein
MGEEAKKRIPLVKIAPLRERSDAVHGYESSADWHPLDELYQVIPKRA